MKTVNNAADNSSANNPTSIEAVKACMNSKIFVDKPYRHWKGLGIMFSLCLMFLGNISAQTVAFDSNLPPAAWYGQPAKSAAREIKSVILELDDEKLNNSYAIEYYSPQKGEKAPYTKCLITESYYAEGKIQKIYGQEIADKTKQIVKTIGVMVYVMHLADGSKYHRVIYHGELILLEKYDENGHSVYRKEY